MGSYPSSKSSRVAITDVRVCDFRSIENAELQLGNLTVLVGPNNAGKTSFLDAMYAAIGAGRKTLSQDDIRLGKGEAFAPKDRKVFVDIRVLPISEQGVIEEEFPEGSYWTQLWGKGIFTPSTDGLECMAFRTTLRWDSAKGEYVVERKFLKDWAPFESWIKEEVKDLSVLPGHLEPIALYYIDAKRDLEEDMRRQGSFWRRMTDDLGLSEAEVAELEASLNGVNQQIVEKSAVLAHLKTNLVDLQGVVSADSAGIEISPIARKLRDLSKGIDVSFSTTGAQAFPLARHGMGTRSLASLLTFRAFAAWRSNQAQKERQSLHPVLALEEPESHLHPQAQRALFAHVGKIEGQRIVSTHSPYFAGQADLEDLRLFRKASGTTSISRLDVSKLEGADVLRKVQDVVIESRGDILFANAVVLFEGQTEELALPVFAKSYWSASIHELGFSFVRANGTDYHPFIWLAEGLGIPWFIFADGEPRPLGELEKALRKAGKAESARCPNVLVLPDGNNFEKQVLADGYGPEAEIALNFLRATYIDDHINYLHGKPLPGGKDLRDYKSFGGRERAILDALDKEKPKVARLLAQQITAHTDPDRKVPPQIKEFFKKIDAQLGATKPEAGE